MKNKLKHIFFASALMAAATNFTACSLDEVNPGEFTMDSLAETEETYEKIINNCYFAMERYFYGASGASGIESNNWMAMTEATTDLWTYQRNKSTSYTQWFWFYAGASPNTTYTDNFWEGLFMMVIIGAIIVIGVIYLLLKRHESRMVLIAAGILMAVIAGKPMAALDAFAKSMTNAGLITSVCSCMGFAMVMKYTGCDKHLVVAIGKVLKKMGFMLIPGATIATFIINIAIPSAAGCSAAVGVIFIPILMSAGIHPAMAAAAVKSGTYGSMLNPGLVHNGVIAKLSNVEITEVITHHMMADIVGVIIAATTLTILAIFLKENKGYLPEGGNDAVAEDLKINPLYALMPLLPVIILLVGSTGMAPILKMGVPQAMLIGALLSLAVTRSNPTKLTKSFFDGMGDAYANIIGIIISVGVFVSGMQSLGLVKALINWMLESTGIVKIAATFGPFILAMISGSGDAATVAFNEAVTPHAAQFGLQAIDMGSMAALGGTLGRTMSPIAGATIICAGIAGVDPMEVCKRNALGITLALLAGMVILLF